MDPEEAPVDLTNAMDLFDNDMVFYKQMFRQFLSYIPAQIEMLSHAALSGDREKAEVYAHGIKGAAGNLSAMKAAVLARNIEKKSRDGETADLVVMIEDLKSEIARLGDFLETLQ